MASMNDSIPRNLDVDGIVAWMTPMARRLPLIGD